VDAVAGALLSGPPGSTTATVLPHLCRPWARTEVMSTSRLQVFLFELNNYRFPCTSYLYAIANRFIYRCKTNYLMLRWVDWRRHFTIRIPFFQCCELQVFLFLNNYRFPCTSYIIYTL
jgi:hypothetical protein